MDEALSLRNELVNDHALIKKLTRETRRNPPLSGIPEARFSGIISVITFSHPVIDFKSQDNRQLLIATTML